MTERFYKSKKETVSILWLRMAGRKLPNEHFNKFRIYKKIYV